MPDLLPRSRAYVAKLRRVGGVANPIDLKAVFTGVAIVSALAMANFLSYQYDVVYDFSQSQFNSLDHWSDLPAPNGQSIYLPPFHAVVVLILILVVIPLGFFGIGLAAWLRRR